MHANPVIPHIKLRGLDADAVYKVDYCRFSVEDTPEDVGIRRSKLEDMTFTGAALMNAGFDFDPMYGVYPSVQLHFTKA